MQDSVLKGNSSTLSRVPVSALDRFKSSFTYHTILTSQDIPVTSSPEFPSNPLPWTLPFEASVPLPLLFLPITKWPSILASSNSGFTSSLSCSHNRKSGFNFCVTSSYSQQDGSVRPSTFCLSVFSVEIWGLLSAGNSLFHKAFLLKVYGTHLPPPPVPSIPSDLRMSLWLSPKVRRRIWWTHTKHWSQLRFSRQARVRSRILKNLNIWQRLKTHEEF